MKTFLSTMIFLLSFSVANAKIINVPTDEPTIQAGIDAAIDGDTVLVADGTYIGEGNINVKLGKEIIVKSENGPENCIIDGQGGFDAGFVSGYVPVSSNAVIEGFTIRNFDFAGIYIFGSSPTIKDNIIESCVIAIDCSGSSTSLIINNEILNTSVTHETSGAITVSNSSATIMNNRIIGTTMTGDQCGAIYCQQFDGSLIINNTIKDNYGCGIYINNRSSGTKIVGNNISQNEAQRGSAYLRCEYDQYNLPYECFVIESRRGGGISVNDRSFATIQNNLICSNTAFRAGGIFCDKTSNARILNNHIINNTSKIGGGIYTNNSSTEIRNNIIAFSKYDRESSGIERWYYTDLFMRYNYEAVMLKSVTYYYGFINNDESGDVHLKGPGIDTSFTIQSGERYWMETNSFVDQYGNGGGINLTISLGSDSLKLNATIGPNGQCYFLYPTTLQSYGTTQAGLSGAGIIVIGDNAFSNIAYNDIYGNEGGNYLVGATSDSTLQVDLTDIDGNISQDPLCEPPDYFLSSGSPCIDAGDPDPSFNDNLRPPGMGTKRCDMGAYGGPGIITDSYLTHNTGNYKISIFQDGSFGHLSSFPTIGEGCEYKNNVDALYASGLIFGTQTAGFVNGNQASFGIVNDFTNTEPIHESTSLYPEMDYISEAAYNDNGAIIPYGVSVHQKAFSNTGDEFVILEFGFTSESSSLDNFYAGIFADWDVGAGEGSPKNLGGYDQSRNLAYQYVNDGSPDQSYYGIVALSGMAGAKVTTDTSEVPMRETALQRISVFEDETITEIGDYRMWIGSGPFTLTQGVTKSVYFAFVAGTDRANLQANADAAAQKYQHIITDVGENEVLLTQFRLSQNYPNPFNPTTLINYQIPWGSEVTLEIFDVLGRRVKTLVDEHKSAGNYKIEFNGGNLSSGVYFYKMQAGSFIDTKKFILIK